MRGIICTLACPLTRPLALLIRMHIGVVLLILFNSAYTVSVGEQEEFEIISYVDYGVNRNDEERCQVGSQMRSGCLMVVVYALSCL